MNVKIFLFIAIALCFAGCKKQPTETTPVPEAEQPAEQPQSQPSGGEHQHHPPDHTVHQERKIPTPLIQLLRRPLDIAPACDDGKPVCSLAILYDDSIVLWDWETNRPTAEYSFPAESYGARSRAPAGKIARDGTIMAALHSSLSQPVYFDSQLNLVSSKFGLPLPVAAAGVNWFSLTDGKFYDFEYLESRGMVAVDTANRLNVAQAGKISVFQRQVGSRVTHALPAIYTSSPTLPGQPDSIYKFSYNNDRLEFITSRLLDGEILDLDVTDLNHDQERELLVVLNTPRGIFVEVLDAF